MNPEIQHCSFFILPWPCPRCKAQRAGELKNFNGIDSDYEVPENPEITVNGGEKTADELAEKIMRRPQGEECKGELSDGTV